MTLFELTAERAFADVPRYLEAEQRDGGSED